MPATAADITAATRDGVTVTWSNPAIRTRYPRARDDSVSPPSGFCDSAADAQTLMDARGVLIGVERRRFAVELADVLWLDLSGGVPTVTLADASQGVNTLAMVTRLEIDLGAETTVLELLV